MARVKIKIEGMDKLQKSLKKLGNVPQKHVTASAKKGMNIVLKQAKADAPKDTGSLKRGMKLSGERSKFKGKKVYRIVFDSAMNSTFQKENKNGEITGYYPASMEYGFFDRKGKHHEKSKNTGWIVGFVHSGLTDNVRKVEKTIVDTMKQKIDAEIAKGGLKK
ncbi:MAG TPA: HK97 gp10 family phage protein [Desulfitobacterium dehalogenans]|uniref:HK97 gp10 family phage protein n=1 Tax=Desulfitobacterium dehalogenans TaxID=36854 RepID=A0A7C7D7V0_9FIRM|nr:HK97 gp10 family phage protein [Desulfitobacterium dehalogenans]